MLRMSLLYALSGVFIGFQLSSNVLTNAFGPLLVLANLISAFIVFILSCR